MRNTFPFHCYPSRINSTFSGGSGRKKSWKKFFIHVDA